MINLLLELSTDYTIQAVFLGTIILGVLAGSLGCFTVLRQQSLLGDCIAHAALPGICIAFLITLSKDPWIILTGAIVSGGLGALVLLLLTHYSKLKQDAILGIILSVFFGFGVVLLTYIQSIPQAHQSGLHTYLFGNASTIIIADVKTMAILAVIALSCLVLLWKEFKVVTFDADFAQTMGIATKKMQFLLSILVVIAIVVGLQAVGVVLMSALVIAPAVAARQWTDRLSKMVILAGILGALSSVIGVVISSSVEKLPTGPVIVLVMSAGVIASIFLAPKRGLLWAVIRHEQHKKHIQEEKVLANILAFSETETDPTFMHDLSPLESLGELSSNEILQRLKQKKLIYSTKKDHWGLTETGVKKAHTFLRKIEKYGT